MVGIIQIEVWETYKDASGRPVESVTARHTVKAEVVDISGGRDTVNGQTNVGSIKRFKFRYLDFKLRGRWKLKYQGKRWTINSIDRVKKAYWIIIASDQS